MFLFIVEKSAEKHFSYNLNTMQFISRLRCYIHIGDDVHNSFDEGPVELSELSTVPEVEVIAVCLIRKSESHNDGIGWSTNLLSLENIA